MALAAQTVAQATHGIQDQLVDVLEHVKNA